MALLEDGLTGGVPRILVGVGTVVAAPALLSAAGRVTRPLAKTLIRRYLGISGALTGLVQEVRQEREGRAKPAQGSKGKSR